MVYLCESQRAEQLQAIANAADIDHDRVGERHEVVESVAEFMEMALHVQKNVVLGFPGEAHGPTDGVAMRESTEVPLVGGFQRISRFMAVLYRIGLPVPTYGSSVVLKRELDPFVFGGQKHGMTLAGSRASVQCTSCRSPSNDLRALPPRLRTALIFSFAAVHFGTVVGQSTLGDLCPVCRRRVWLFLLPLAGVLVAGALTAFFLTVREIPLFFKL